MNKRKLSIVGIVCGILLTLGPVWGMALTALSVSHAFAILGESGTSDPRLLARDVGNSLMATTIGFALCPVGLLVLAVSLFLLFQKRTPPPLPQKEIPDQR